MDRKGTRAAAEAYLQFLYTDAAQEIIARHYYRPTNEAVLKAHAATLPRDAAVPDQGDRAGLRDAHKQFFADGGVFDKIYTAEGEAQAMTRAEPPRCCPASRSRLGYTLFYLTVLVVLPLLACFTKAGSLTCDEFWAAVWTERTRAAYALTFGTSFAAAAVNVALGLLVAWVLVRYGFPGQRLFDALVDLPFALPTAVAGLVYASLYVKNGWLGQFLVPLGIEGAYSPARHRAGAGLHRLPVRGAHGAAGAGGPRRRGRRRRPPRWAPRAGRRSAA